MPFYSYVCEHCHNPFEIRKSFEEAGDIPRCPICKRKRDVYRDWLSDNIHVSEGPKTIGSLADRNGDKYTEDHKQHIRDKLDPKKNQGKVE